MTRLVQRPLWVVLALVFVAYVGVLGAGFVFDDHFLIEQNTVLTAPTFDTLFRRDLWCCAGAQPSAYYRPATALSFLLDAKVWGLAPAGFHATSLVLHLVAVALVAALLAPRIGVGRSAVAALLFGLHPIQSEAVAWVAARNDPLVAVAALGALLMLDRRTPAATAGAAALTLLACLAKESGWMLPALAWCWRRAWGERLARVEWGALLGGVALSLALRAQVLWSPLGEEVGGRGQDPEAVLRAVATYLGWILWPWPLTSTLSAALLPPSPMAWVAAAVCVTLAVWATCRGGGWLILWAAVAFIPAVLGITGYGLIGERYLYLPLFGVVAAVARVAPAGRGALVALGAVTAAFVGVLHVRIPDWRSDVTLFAAADARLGDSTSRGLHAHAVEEAGDHTLALRLYTEALTMSPVSRYSCAYVLPLAADQLPPDVFGEQVTRWGEGPCRRAPGFLPRAMKILVRKGQLGAADRLACLDPAVLHPREGACLTGGADVVPGPPPEP